MDISAAKSQAQVILRIANGIERRALREGDSLWFDTAQHLRDEACYLMNYLDMPKEEQV